ncbi:MAG: S8 family serine peptidase [Hoylesella buccalis]
MALISPTQLLRFYGDPLSHQVFLGSGCRPTPWAARSMWVLPMKAVTLCWLTSTRVTDGYRTHGTHTLGIAAGSGYDSPYRGMAYESDICLVSNAVSDDEQFIDSADYYKYTYATDALGFKYIMDYARERNLPCVISFSEGSNQDFHGDDQLYYAILDSLSGPGRIIVASAGNEGAKKSFFRKPIGKKSAGTFVSDSRNSLYFTLKSPQPFTLPPDQLWSEHRNTDHTDKAKCWPVPTHSSPTPSHWAARPIAYASWAMRPATIRQKPHTMSW